MYILAFLSVLVPLFCSDYKGAANGLGGQSGLKIFLKSAEPSRAQAKIFSSKVLDF
jgi:hypothetical protein